VKIIVDTNIVFSALLNSTGKIGNILLHSREHLQFFTCEYLHTEILRHRKKILKFTKLPEPDLIELESLIAGRITFINEKLLPQSLLLKTEILLKDIDQNDTPFVALAQHIAMDR